MSYLLVFTTVVFTVVFYLVLKVNKIIQQLENNGIQIIRTKGGRLTTSLLKKTLNELDKSKKINFESKIRLCIYYYQVCSVLVYVLMGVFLLKMFL